MEIETTPVVFKTRIHLNNKQQSWMRSNCIAARIAYNYAVRFIDDAYFKATSYEIVKWWSYERDDRHPWMKQKKLVMEGGNRAITINFANALKKWKRDKWNKDSAPRYHGKHSDFSVSWSYLSITNKHIEGRTVTLPKKMGTARLAEPLRFPGKVMQTTFTEAGGKWYVSVLTRTPVTALEKPAKPQPGTVVGVDVGVANFVSLSNGEQFPPVASYDHEQAKLVKLQQQLSRMEGPVKGQRKASKNWKKQNAKVAKQHRRIANIRRNYTEHVSLDLAQRFETVVIEDLKLKNMTRSAKGTKDAPGKNVAAKSGLNRAILNCGFGQFRVRLENKVVARGGAVVAVNPAYASQTCPACGHIAKENRPSQAEFRCVACGHGGHADVVAAQNIAALVASGKT